MRLTPGALALWYHQTFEDGVRVAWFRDVIRPRILSTPPISETTDTSCEIHVLTSRSDWLNLIWTLKTFYLKSGRRWALCIHEDGSLGDNELAVMRQHFPDARIVLRQEADSLVNNNLKSFPRSRAFRDENVLATKIFDFKMYLQSDRMALFDSDLLFFDKPEEFLNRAENKTRRLNSFNRDAAEAYTIEPDVVEHRVGHPIVRELNSGFGIVHSDSLRWDWTEEFLALPGLLDGHFWRIEQTLYALCSSRFGVELLPDEYTVTLKHGITDKCFRHYVGAIRPLMYGEGIARLFREGFMRWS